MVPGRRLRSVCGDARYRAMVNTYVDEERMAREVEAGRHRDVIGGLWDELGDLQLAFLKAQGLAPHHVLLDVGCGSGRLAVKAVPYLDAGRYYGIDLSPALLRAARREVEAAGCGGKLAPDSLHAAADFRPPADAPAVDFAIAQSVFTHLPLDHLTVCLNALAGRLAPGGRLFATFFTAPEGIAELAHDPGGIVTFADRDPFHFPVESILAAAIAAGWTPRWIGAWDHPRDQQMCEFAPPR